MNSTECALGAVPLPGAAVSPVETRPAQIVRPYGRSPKQAIKKSRRHIERLERRIEKATRAGGARNERKARSLAWMLRKSYDGKIVAVAHAGATFKSKGRKHPAGQEIIDIAGRISVTTTPEETIRVYAKDKARWEEFRAIHVYGIENTARQNLVLRSLRRLLPVTADQHGTQNGGRRVACERVREALASGQYKYVATPDIKDFYPTCDREWLRHNLPIDGRITTSTLFVDNDHDLRQYEFSGYGLYRHCLSAYGLYSASQRGLPQGASPSPLIADYIIGLALQRTQLPTGVLLVNYADNFAILGRTRADVETAVNTLRGAFERHPAGSFRTTGLDVRRATDGFDFLGYHFKRDRQGAAVRPTKENVAKLECGIAKRVLEIVEGEATKQLQRFLSGWRKAFALYRQADFHICTAVRNCARAFPERAVEIRRAIRKIEAENARMLAIA